MSFAVWVLRVFFVSHAGNKIDEVWQQMKSPQPFDQFKQNFANYYLLFYLLKLQK